VVAGNAGVRRAGLDTGVHEPGADFLSMGIKRMGTEATNHEPNDTGEPVSNELETLRAALQTTQADLERVAVQRDQFKSALAELFKQNERIMQERNKAQVRCRELADVCLGQQSLIARLFDQLGASIRSLRHAEHLPGIIVLRALRIPGITVRAVS
jgi:chromosome segregation ATPase